MKNNTTFTFKHYQKGSDVPIDDRAPIIHAMNHELICTNWDFDYPHYSESMHPFHDKYSLIYVYDDTRLIAYTIYQFVQIPEGIPTIYRFASEIKKSYHGKGIYKLLTDRAFEDIWTRLPDSKEFLFCWRTRNPIIWRESAKRCTSVVPVMSGSEAPDPQLISAGQFLARHLYPDAELEMPNMIMRDIYTHMRYHEQPRLDGDSPINAKFESLIPAKEDAIFSVGRVQK